MKQASFILKIDGEGISDGDIDVNDLAPALLAVGELLKTCNSVLNGEDAELSVRVKATSAGCFEVDFTMVQTLLESLFEYAKTHKDGIASANDLLDLVFKVVGIPMAVGGGLLGLLRFLKGGKPDSKSEDSNQDIVVTIGTLNFTADPRAIELAENRQVREKVEKLVTILERDGIESMEFSETRDYAGSLIIKDSEVSSFKVPDFDEKEIESIERQMALQIVSLSFKEENKWKVTDGGEPFFATIVDLDFLKKIATNEKSFSKNDILTCMVRETQFETRNGLRKDRVVVRVIEHKKAMQQLPLI